MFHTKKNEVKQHLYYSIAKIQSASFPSKGISIVNEPGNATINTYNTLNISIIIYDNYLDKHNENYDEITINLSETIYLKITDTYSSKNNYSDIKVTFTSKTVTIDDINVTLSIDNISQRLNGITALTYDKNIKITVTVENSSKTYTIIAGDSKGLRINQGSTGKVGVRFK